MKPKPQGKTKYRIQFFDAWASFGWLDSPNHPGLYADRKTAYSQMPKCGILDYRVKAVSVPVRKGRKVTNP